MSNIHHIKAHSLLLCDEILHEFSLPWNFLKCHPMWDVHQQLLQYLNELLEFSFFTLLFEPLMKRWRCHGDSFQSFVGLLFELSLPWVGEEFATSDSSSTTIGVSIMFSSLLRIPLLALSQQSHFLPMTSSHITFFTFGWWYLSHEKYHSHHSLDLKWYHLVKHLFVLGSIMKQFDSNRSQVAWSTWNESSQVYSNLSWNHQTNLNFLTFLTTYPQFLIKQYHYLIVIDYGMVRLIGLLEHRTSWQDICIKASIVW